MEKKDGASARWSSETEEAGAEEEKEEEVEATTAPSRRRLKEHASSPPTARRTIRGSAAGIAAFLSTALPPGARARDLDTSREEISGAGRIREVIIARRDEGKRKASSGGDVAVVVGVDDDRTRRAAARSRSLAAVVLQFPKREILSRETSLRALAFCSQRARIAKEKRQE